MLGAKMLVTGVVMAVVVVDATATTADTCTTTFAWNCTGTLKLSFSGVQVNDCEEKHDKELFAEITGVTYPGVSEGEASKYTIIITDPDAPGNDGDQGYLHWIRAGLTAADLTGQLETGTDVISYVPPTPPRGTGVHRYFTALFREAAHEEQKPVTKRQQFNIMHYIAENKLCGPLADAMFRAEY